MTDREQRNTAEAGHRGERVQQPGAGQDDSWCSLEEAATQLALAGARQRPVESLSETVHGLLDVLGPIERFWAFPGLHSFQKVRRLFGAGKYDRFATMVSGINRALATDSSGRRSAETGAEDEAVDRVIHPMEQAGPTARTSRCSSSRKCPSSCWTRRGSPSTSATPASTATTSSAAT
ncbi:MAG TPA: hypothetical protein VFQ68_19955 [Streptosporangiaceae bacterium]|nr:hypothetical protein [Streptosporangiaceae bacterium]